MNNDRVKIGLCTSRIAKVHGRQYSALIKNAVWILMLAFIVGCSGGSSSGGGGPSAEEAADIAGVWSVYEVVDASDCGDGTETDNYYVIIEQEGSQITITAQGNEFFGSINGDIVSWSGSFPEGDGTTNITSMSLTLSADGASLSGSCAWTWSDGVDTCSGTTQITSTRDISSSVDVAGTWEGNWHSNSGFSGVFTAVVVQHDTVLSGTISVPYIDMDAELKGSVTGNTMVFGDVGGVITFTGVVSGYFSSGTYYYSSLDDDGTWDATR